ncbi:MAG TPA: ABC transporter permease [Porticoccaceae bacterium]|nr:ABC transporter permease [Porticoccaceae bacterium]HCO59356.1 ABC transporter permease [Porticoccaceae bacterium]
MTLREQWVAFVTLVTREIRRFVRIWQQTLLPPAITIALYFIIFGTLIGPRIGQMAGFSYIEFVVPGLIMLAVITNSFGNVVSSFFGNKFAGNIEEMLVSPMPNYVILLGYLTGGVARGLAVGAIVTLASMFFTRLNIQHPLITLGVIVLTATLFSLAGLINAVYADNFDDISIIPTFVLTPLTYLGGVFYSMSLLPEFWQGVSKLNPVLYMVNAFRYGFLGVSDIDVLWAFLMLFVLVVVLFFFSLRLLETGKNLRA